MQNILILYSGQATLKSISKRREWIDYARGMAIILVVFGHVSAGFINTGIEIHLLPSKIAQVIYYARMPLFFVISGIFIRKSYEKRGFKSFIEYKFSTILYPYFIWGGLQLFFQIIAYKNGLSNTPRHPSDFLSLAYQPHEIDQFWFLYALFGVALIFAMLQYFFKIKKGSFLIIGLLTYVIYYYLPETFQIFGTKSIFKFLFYIALGDMISATVLNANNFEKLASVKWMILFFGLFILVKILMIWQQVPETETNFFTLKNLILLLCIFTGLALMLNLSFLLDRFQRLKWLRKIGRYSLYIYIMHIIVSGISRAALLKITGDRFPDLSLYMVTGLSIGLPIVIYKVTNSLGMWFLYSPHRSSKNALSI